MRSIKLFALSGLLISLFYPVMAYSAPTSNFSDVSSSYWAKDDISTLTSMGYIDGYEDGTFRPEQNVTREEFAKLLVQTFGLDPIAGESSFADVEPGRWSTPFIEAAKPYMAYYIGPT
jgi:hypothetical protein